MSISKSHAFLIGLIAVMILAVLDFILTKDYTEYIKAIVALVTLYMGISVANNGVKGKTWNQQMYDTENKDDIK